MNIHSTIRHLPLTKLRPRKPALTCDCHIIHQDAVIKAFRHKPADGELQGLSELFKILSEPTRIQILWTLDQGEMCVCDIANVLNMTKSAVSHQLAILRDAKIIKYRRAGREIYYEFDDDHIKTLYEIGLEHISHLQNH